MTKLSAGGQNNNTVSTTGKYVPVTPGGTPCTWLASTTELEAWNKLLADAAHMPYKDIEGFKARGYTVEKW